MKLSPHVQGHTWVASETRCISTTSIAAEAEEVGVQTMYLPLYQTGLHGPRPERKPPQENPETVCWKKEPSLVVYQDPDKHVRLRRVQGKD